MEDRVKINGVWYVREQPDAKEEPIQIDPVEYIGCVYENEDYCWEATRLYKDLTSCTFYEVIDIKFTNKRLKPWKEEHWDNNDWMLGVLNNDSESMTEARLSMDEQGIRTFKALLEYLKSKGWL